MGAKKSLKISTILKRSRAVNSVAESSAIDNSSNLYNRIMNMLESKKSGAITGVQPLINSYISSMCDSSSASNAYWQPIKLIETFNIYDESAVIADKISLEFSNRILPYIEASQLQDVMNTVENSELTDFQKALIEESIAEYHASDRILSNHKSLSKRFNIEESVTKYSRNNNLKYFVDHCADLISTYAIEDYQKMNATLEESIYVLEKQGVHCDREDIARYLVEYYLTQKPVISSEEKEQYRKVLTESPLLTEEDLKSVQFFFEDASSDFGSISKAITAFLQENNKTPEKLENIVTVALSSTTADDITSNIDSLICTVWDCSKNKIFESDESLYKVVGIVSDYINEAAMDTDLVKDDVTEIIEKVQDLSDKIVTIGNSNSEYSESAVNFVANAIDPLMENLNNLSNLLYASSNIEAIKYLNESDAVMPLNEFKLFKFNNLVKAAFNLDRFLAVKERKLYDKIKGGVKKFVKKAKDVLFGETVDIMSVVGDDNKADICVKQYFYNENGMSEFINFLETACGEYNDLLVSQNETCRAYYIIHPGLAEVRIKESTAVSDLASVEELYKVLDPAMDTYFDLIGESKYVCTKTLKGIAIKSIDEDISAMSELEDFDMERFKLALEAMSIIGVDQETVSRFGDKFNNKNFNQMVYEGTVDSSYVGLSKQEKEVDRLVESYTIEEDAEWADKVEAYAYLQTLFEYNYPDEDSDDDDDEDDEEYRKFEEEKKKAKEDAKSGKKPSEVIPKEDQEVKEDPNPPKNGYKGRFDINSIALALKGLRTKFKEMNNKQQEASRNLDSAVRSFTNATKRAFTNDRREAIIKGSVVPSFSRCIKSGIVLAALGVVATPVVAVIAGVAGLAMSKKLNKRERVALLDEIETELEVIEKELAIADSNNNMQKYRTLLQYKKELQRQYQRIKYNIKIEDTRISSHVGVERRDEY